MLFFTSAFSKMIISSINKHWGWNGSNITHYRMFRYFSHCWLLLHWYIFIKIFRKMIAGIKKLKSWKKITWLLQFWWFNCLALILCKKSIESAITFRQHSSQSGCCVIKLYQGCLIMLDIFFLGNNCFYIYLCCTSDIHLADQRYWWD